MATNLYQASNQWARRPADERFLTIEDLKAAVYRRRDLSTAVDARLGTLSVEYDDDNQLFVDTQQGDHLGFTNWSFRQLATQAQAPAGYLAKLPAPLARANLLYGLQATAESADAKLLSMGNETLRAVTSTTYGRIWDAQVVDAVEWINQDGRWTVPLQAYNGVNSKQATTLYASDRDVFLFLVDENRPIDIDGQTYFRGFYSWNSEVGNATFGICTFLYSYVCQNRIIWDAKEVKELRIRHSKFAPERFVEQAVPALTAISDASPAPIVEAIKDAKRAKIADTVKDVESWLVKQGFGKAEAATAVHLAEQGGDTGSSGDPLNKWDVVQGLTAYARGIPYTDERIDFERKAASLLSV